MPRQSMIFPNENCGSGEHFFCEGEKKKKKKKYKEKKNWEEKGNKLAFLMT